MRTLSEIEMKAVSGGAGDVIVVTGIINQPAYWDTWMVEWFMQRMEDDYNNASGGGTSGGGETYYTDVSYEPPAAPPDFNPLPYYNPDFINSQEIQATTDPQVLQNMIEQAELSAQWWYAWANYYNGQGHLYDLAGALTSFVNLSGPFGIWASFQGASLDDLVWEMAGYGDYWNELAGEAQQRLDTVT